MRWVGDTDWIDLDRDRDMLPDLVFAIINNKRGEARTVNFSGRTLLP
jgi:hypothetical protein